MSEIRRIDVVAYRDNTGRPTCRARLHPGSCQFLSSTKFGTVPVCMATWAKLETYGDLGYIKPSDDCIVWGRHD